MITVLEYVFHMGIYIIILYGAHELFRKYPKGTTVFFILTLCTFPLWLNHIEGWFRWGKTLIVLIPTCFLNLVRLSNGSKPMKWKVFQKNWVYWALYLTVFFNIVEASVKDLTLGNYLNGICGFILCITMARPLKAWKIDKTESSDLIADLPFIWSLLYTTWNACFVYGENPSYFASSLCILAVPVLRGLFNKRTDLWMSARAYTLAIHVFIRAFFGDIITPRMDSSSWTDSRALYIWGIINIVLHVAYALWYFTKEHKYS